MKTKTFANSLDPDQVDPDDTQQTVESRLGSKLFDIQLLYQQTFMEVNNCLL